MISLFVLLCLAATASAEPVDNHQFGFIKNGMRQDEVLSRLGVPDSAQDVALVAKRQYGPSGQREIAIQRRERWCWLGNSQVRTKCVVIEGERVIQLY